MRATLFHQEYPLALINLHAILQEHQEQNTDGADRTTVLPEVGLIATYIDLERIKVQT